MTGWPRLLEMAETASNPFLDSLLGASASSDIRSGPEKPHAWLNRLRASALERAHALTLPTLRDEDWRFTDLSALYKLGFKSAVPTPPVDPARLGRDFAPEAAIRLVFVNGHFAPALSVTGIVEGVTATPLASGIELHGRVIEARLARLADLDDPFRAINTAHLNDGAVVIGHRGASGAPIQLVFVSTQAEAAVHPRCLVIAEAGSDLVLLEDYLSLHDGLYWVNGVTEVAVGPNARVRHVRRQAESSAAFHIATCAVRLERDAVYESVAIALGARLSRYNLHVRQADEGTNCRLDGLALIKDRQLADTHSFIDHAAPHGTSRQLHKCVVGGHAHAVFNGRILVRPGAQLTDSAQSSRNLLLSPRAHVDTKPQLEIFADDVKCSHGATVGQLEAEEMFYLRSRGLAEPAARSLLTYGFAAEIVDRIPVPSVVAALRRTVLEQTQTSPSVVRSLYAAQDEDRSKNEVRPIS